MGLVEIFSSPFFQQSFIGMMLMSFPFAVIGTCLIEKRLSLVADTFSHALLPGVVLSSMLTGMSLLGLLVGGWMAGLLLAALSWWIQSRKSGTQDSQFAFLSLLFVASGMILAFKFQTSSEILHLLFGNVFVFDSQLNLILLALLALSFIFFWTHRDLWSLWILDPSLLIFKTKEAHRAALLMVVISTMYMTLGLYSLGSLMMVGFLIIPAMTAQNLFHRLYTRLIATLVLSLVAQILGLTLSFRLDLPIGPSLVVSLGGLYVLSAWFASSHQKPLKAAALSLVLLMILPVPSKASSKKVLSTFAILHDITQNTGPALGVEYQSLLSFDREPHDLQLTPTIYEKLKNADLVVYWGLGLDEAFVQRFKKRKPNTAFCLATEKLNQKSDPHAWQSPQLTLQVIAQISECLQTLFPDKITNLESQKKVYSDKIQKIGAHYQTQFKGYPENKKVFVSSHQAFGTWKEEFGLHFLSIQGQDPHTEPSGPALESLVKEIQNKKAQFFFPEPKSINGLTRRLIRMTELKIQDPLFSETLSAEGGPAPSYEKLLHYNLGLVLKTLEKEKLL